MSCLRGSGTRILLRGVLCVGLFCGAAAVASSNAASDQPAGRDGRASESRGRPSLPASAALLLFGLLGAAAAVTAFSVHLACEWSDAPSETESAIEATPGPLPNNVHPRVLSPHV